MLFTIPFQVVTTSGLWSQQQPAKRVVAFGEFSGHLIVIDTRLLLETVISTCTHNVEIIRLDQSNVACKEVRVEFNSRI